MRQFTATVEKITETDGLLTVIGTLYDENGREITGCKMRQRIRRGKPVGTANTLMASARSFLVLAAYNNGGQISGDIPEVMTPDEEDTASEIVGEKELVSKSPWYLRLLGWT